MSRKTKIYGQCAICGSESELSFEHVPPKASFNESAYYSASLEQLLKLNEVFTNDSATFKKQIKGKKLQGGVGFHTLCNQCNNNTGSWYGRAFSDWIHQCMSIVHRASGNPTLIYPTKFFPLRVLKQIVTMFFSLNKDSLRYSNPELVRFVLNKEEKYMPKARIYCYYNIIGSPRYLGFMASGNFAGETKILSELTFPPMGFVITDRLYNSIDSRLAEITHFAHYGYDEELDFFQRFNTLPTHMPFIPGDYRSKHEVEDCIVKNKQS